MSCKGLTGTSLKNCKAKALKKAKAQAYALLKKRHPNIFILGCLFFLIYIYQINATIKLMLYYFLYKILP